MSDPLSVARSDSEPFAIMSFERQNFKILVKYVFYSCFLFTVFIFIIE